MPKANASRKGSLAFRPRKRASTFNARIRNWPTYRKPSLLGFAGYKAGMLHFAYNEDQPNSPLKGKEVSAMGTLIEVPPIHVYGIRAYKKTSYGMRLLGDFFVKDDPQLKKARIKIRKGKEISELDKYLEEISDVRALVFTNPSMTSIGKKTPERIELGVGGDSVKSKVEYLKSIIGKDVNVEDVLEKGSYVDVIGVTKGKGWQGVVKRFGIAIQRRKATGKRRHLGNLGSWHPPIVEYTIAQAGQMGLHKRTILNNLVVDMGTPDKIDMNGGIINYGVIKTRYILIKGSIPGPKKRLVKLRRSLRKPISKRDLKVTYLSRAM
ncbi:MAG: 50S ribosomal protein L3 [Candidatus Micrarchaeia archaeon]